MYFTRLHMRITVTSYEHTGVSNHRHLHCLFVFCSDIYQRKHQLSVLLIPIEDNPWVPRGFISQRASSTWNVSVLWHYNGARPVTSPGIVEIGQRRVCVNFNRSGIVAPTWHQWNGHLCFDMAIKTTHNHRSMIPKFVTPTAPSSIDNSWRSTTFPEADSASPNQTLPFQNEHEWVLEKLG